MPRTTIIRVGHREAEMLDELLTAIHSGVRAGTLDRDWIGLTAAERRRFERLQQKASEAHDRVG